VRCSGPEVVKGIFAPGPNFGNDLFDFSEPFRGPLRHFHKTRQTPGTAKKAPRLLTAATV